MLKTGFRGERKGILTPDHILSYSETTPKERGNVVTEKESSPLPSPKERGNVVTEIVTERGNVETGIIPVVVLPFRFYLRKLCVKHS